MSFLGGLGGGGGAGSSGGGSSPMNPVGTEFGGSPNADVGGQPSSDLFNTDAMNTGTSAADYSPATAAYAQTPAAAATQAAQATAAPAATVAPGGEQSGGGGGIGEVLASLVGRGNAGTPTRDETAGLYASAAGRGVSPGAGWYTTQPRGPTDQYGNTYTTQPGYQASPMSPLPPSSGQNAPPAPPYPPSRAPAAPPAPAPRPSAGGGRSRSSEDIPLPRARPPEADATPPPEPPVTTQPTPEEIERGQAPVGPPGTITAGPQAYPPTPYPPTNAELRGRIPAQVQIPGVPPMSAATAAGYQVQNPPGAATAAPATVSPQFAPAPGNNPPGWGQTILGPNTYRQYQREIQSGSPLGKLLQGDLTGAVNSFIGQLRAQNPNLVTPQDVNRTMKGDFQGRPSNIPANQPRRTQAPSGEAERLATARTFVPSDLSVNQAPPATPGNLSANRFTPGARGPMDPLTAQVGPQAPVSRETAPPGAAPAAPAQPLRLGQPNQTPQQTERLYQAWLRDRNLPNNAQTRTRFNIENGTFRNMRNQSVLPGQQDRRIWTDERGRLLNAPGQTGRYPTPGTGSLSPAEMDTIRQQGQIPDPRSPQQEVPPGGAGAGGLRNQAPDARQQDWRNAPNPHDQFDPAEAKADQHPGEQKWKEGDWTYYRYGNNQVGRYRTRTPPSEYFERTGPGSRGEFLRNNRQAFAAPRRSREFSNPYPQPPRGGQGEEKLDFPDMVPNPRTDPYAPFPLPPNPVPPPPPPGRGRRRSLPA